MKKLMAVLLVAQSMFVFSSVTHAAGDASAIRRATRTQDSRWVSNYRPGASNYGTTSRGSSYRRYSANVNRGSVAAPSVASQPAAPVSKTPATVPSNKAPAKTAQPNSKSPVR
ncbi:MAG TPA: hypothetical protein VGN12_12885 [Pirellulales bacterium]